MLTRAAECGKHARMASIAVDRTTTPRIGAVHGAQRVLLVIGGIAVFWGLWEAYRWIGEMEEIAQCFEDLGLPGRMLLGAADVYTNVRDGGLLATELPVESVTR